VTALGALRGVADGGVCSFLGVAYALAPVAALRWAAPRPLDPWDGTLDALRPAPPAPQPERPLGVRSHGELPPGDEDCLRLNVWSPALDDAAARPVLVWLHGGGWVLGSPSASLFDGASLARALDAVIVTVGYRLGSLGWLHHASLAAQPGGACGNWGLLDQLAALRWVSENAEAFGGDPGRIVLAGESAGAASVVQLLGAPGAEGLAQRAIAMSPPLGESTIGADLAERWSAALALELTGEEMDPARMRAIAAGRCRWCTPPRFLANRSRRPPCSRRWTF
jgi:para-nitrobenzyl esterase